MISRADHAKFLAGGTNLIDLMRENVERPDHLVDVTGLPLVGIEELPDGGLRIGALVRNSHLAASWVVRERYPALSQAILMGASAQIRNMATTGGNLMQRTRCYYFYDGHAGCNKRTPGTGCDALEGFNRIHAILGASTACIATHPSDMCVALAALDASVLVQGPAGKRAISISDFHRLPGDTPHIDTTLRQDELIIAVDIPPLPLARNSAYRKVRDRASYAFALVSVAAALDVDGGTVTDARLALGGWRTSPGARSGPSGHWSVRRPPQRRSEPRPRRSSGWREGIATTRSRSAWRSERSQASCRICWTDETPDESSKREAGRRWATRESRGRPPQGHRQGDVHRRIQDRPHRARRSCPRSHRERNARPDRHLRRPPRAGGQRRHHPGERPAHARGPVFGSPTGEPAAAASRIRHLGTNQIYYYGQPIAVVVAETLEEAEQAATLIAVEYAPLEAKTSFEAEKGKSIEPSDILGEPAAITKGDPDAALAAAPYKVDNVYRTPPFNHNAIELHATIAHWSEDEERLTVYDATQYVAGTQHMLANQFGLPKDNVRVIASFVGGGFGGKGTAWPHVALAAAAAKVAKRPVKLVLSRAEVHHMVGGRTPTEQRVALGATDAGQLRALIQTGITWTNTHVDFAEPFTFPARHLYACDNIRLGQKVVYLDIVPNTYMRAPGESVGTFALESAIDELAHEIGMDPIALRMRNEPDADPTSGMPFSTRNLREAYRVGAEQFGWARRKAAPRTTREGRHLVGYGVATAYYPAYQFPSAARVTIHTDGSAVGQSSAHEMGMGTATAQAQHLADQLGLPLERVRFEYGDSRFPEAPVAGGSTSTISVGAAVIAASDAAKRKIHGLVRDDERSAVVGTRLDEVDFRDGGIYRRDLPTREETFAAILQRLGIRMVEADGESSRGAELIEVRVDEVTGEVRVTRALGVFDCGRIINPKTASSQWRGGIVTGIGMALSEEALFDPRLGRIVNPSLAEYHVPVNLDVPDIEVHFLDIPDRLTPMGARGIGEIGITGVAASVANAVFNATGKRIRELPITLDKLL
jgi:xanthine dehydrogenase YagR molybdenum-binding subunit